MANIHAAGIRIINQNDEILLLHRKTNVPEGNRWGIPGGKLIANKTIEETAIQKTFEESGIIFEIDNLKKLDTFQYTVEENEITFDVFVSRSNNPLVRLNDEGHDTYQWLHPRDAIQRDDLMVGMYPILKALMPYLEQNLGFKSQT